MDTIGYISKNKIVHLAIQKIQEII